MDSVKRQTPYTNSRAVYGMVIDVGSPGISLSTLSTKELGRLIQDNWREDRLDQRPRVWCQADVGKDHGYFTFAEVVCGTWLESDPDTSSGGVHPCSLLPETKRDTQTPFTVKSIKSAAISWTLPSVAVTSWVTRPSKWRWVRKPFDWIYPCRLSVSGSKYRNLTFGSLWQENAWFV